MSYKYIENRSCEYYPCHNMENMNCLFCYCPLYLTDCGGSYNILSNGIKDCSNCTIPHVEKNYEYILSKFRDAASKKAQQPSNDSELK